MRILHLYVSLTILLLAGIFFIPFLGNVHLFDWDEVNFAESAREMIVTGNYSRVQINFTPFWEKPPLFFWMQTTCMHIFGINEFSARLPNAIGGIVTLLLLFFLGRKFFNIRFGIFWALAYAGSFLPHFYFKSGIIDPWFNLFIFLSILFLVILTSLSVNFYFQRLQFAFLSGLSIGLAILTKGPAALVILLLSIGVYMIVNRTWRLFSIRETLIFFASALVINFLWFAVETFQHGPWFLKEFIVYQIRLFRTEDAGHGGPFFYHFIVLLIGCFPASVFALKSFRKFYSDNPLQNNFRVWMTISFFVVLILFSILRTKTVHYSSFTYFPISFLAAYTLNKARLKRVHFRSLVPGLILVIGSVISIILVAFPLLMKNIDSILDQYGHLIEDDFALATLEANLYWSGTEIWIGIFYFIIILLVFINFHKQVLTWSLVLFSATIIVIQAGIYTFIPRVEEFVQGANIEFFKSVAEANAYVDVYGYKSYAHLFYGKRMPEELPQAADKHYLLHGDINRPVYISTKIHLKRDLADHPDFTELFSKNGFVFYRRGSKE
ncbi:MAG: ArnT family glycosyltransferase [Cytophagaceae bacterium]